MKRTVLNPPSACRGRRPESRMRCRASTDRTRLAVAVVRWGIVQAEIPDWENTRANPEILVRLLLVGDVVGKPGRQIVARATPGLRIEQELDLVVVNAENAAGGSGLTPAIYQELISAGVDCITMGDHIYRRREIFPILHAEARIVRPANYPPEAPGRPFTVITARNNVRVAVISLLGASSCRRSIVRSWPPTGCWPLARGRSRDSTCTPKRPATSN